MPRHLLSLLAENEPELIATWSIMVREDLEDAARDAGSSSGFPRLAEALILDLQRDQGGAVASPQLIVAAATHGSERREQHLYIDQLFRELALFGDSVELVLKRHAPGTDHLAVLARVGSLLSTATMAAARGYHRREFESVGRWPEVSKI